MILKSTMMPQIKEAFVGSEGKHKMYITMSIRVLFWCLFYRHHNFKKMACLFVPSFQIYYVFILLLLLEKNWYPSENSCSHMCATKYQTHFENQLNNVWTWNNSMLKKYHKRDSADRVRIIWAQFGGKCLLGTPRLTALKLFLEKVFSSDSNSNLKWAI
jgi:hypothetical protein